MNKKQEEEDELVLNGNDNKNKDSDIINLLLTDQDETEKLLLDQIKRKDSREKFFINTKSQSFEELTETSKIINRSKKNEEPPIRLIDDEEEEEEFNRNTNLINLTKTLKSIKKSNTVTHNSNAAKKQLQFNVEHKNEDVKRNSSNLHDALNQIKSAELNKRRASTITSLTNRSKRKKTGWLNLKKFDAFNVKWQKSVYNLLERPSGTLGFIYRIYIFTIILGSILTGALNTLESMNKWSYDMFFWYEFSVTLYFAVEYLLRVWSCGHRISYQGFTGRISYCTRPLLLIELGLITISVFLLSMESYYNDEKLYKSRALTALHFFQIVRFLYIDRHAQTWTLLLKVMSKHRFELLSSVYIGVIILFISSYFILLVEKPYSVQENDNMFHSYADALYWSIITMTTIGYGKFIFDKYFRL